MSNASFCGEESDAHFCHTLEILEMYVITSEEDLATEL
jgi:hypothetical protein